LDLLKNYRKQVKRRYSTITNAKKVIKDEGLEIKKLNKKIRTLERKLGLPQKSIRIKGMHFSYFSLLNRIQATVQKLI